MKISMKFSNYQEKYCSVMQGVIFHENSWEICGLVAIFRENNPNRNLNPKPNSKIFHGK